MRLTNRVSEKQANHALAMTNAIHLLHTEVRPLSGGEFQRVMLARAIASKPDLIVLDEPVRGVDFNGEIALYELIKEVRNEFENQTLFFGSQIFI